MGNVIPLFAPKNAEMVVSESETCIAAAVARILTSSAQLDHAVNDLSEHFDSIEKAIDTIDDTETRTRLQESTKLSRETLLNAMRKLSQQIGTLVGCRGA